MDKWHFAAYIWYYDKRVIRCSNYLSTFSNSYLFIVCIAIGQIIYLIYRYHFILYIKCLFVYSSILLSFFMSIFVSICLYMYISVYIYLYILSIYLSVCLSVYLFGYLYLFIYLSVYPIRVYNKPQVLTSKVCNLSFERFKFDKLTKD